jgi:hypothetical protein
MFRQSGSKIVKLYQRDLAIKKDAQNFILWGGARFERMCLYYIPHFKTSP